MSETRGGDRDRQPGRPSRFVQAVAVASAMVALAGCSSANKKSAQPNLSTASSALGHEPTAASEPTTDSGPKGVCGARSYEFGQFFSADNATEIYEELGLLRTLQTHNRQLTTTDAGIGSEIIVEMIEDPADADGMAAALQHIQDGQPVTLGSFLQTPTGRLDVCGTDHMGPNGTAQWQKNVTKVGHFLTSEGVNNLFRAAGPQVELAGARMQERIEHLINYPAA